MPSTENLGLPFLEAGQAQKHVTLNEALRMLDALVQLSVRGVAASPPDAPEHGWRYIVGDEAADEFEGRENQVAVFEDGAWRFFAPEAGWIAFLETTGELCAFDGAAWVTPRLSALQEIDLLGVRTHADETNPFAAKLNNVLFTARETGEGGDGDLRFKVSKQSFANTASLLFQAGYSGRAEVGLTGSDDFRFKVSADGSAWRDGIVIAADTGLVSFPQGVIGLREKLIASRTYYVRPDGDDANDGLSDTSSGAFATIQKAADVVFGSLDLGGFDVTIQLADGSYSAGVMMKHPQVGAGLVTIQGNASSPANVVLSNSSAAVLAVIHVENGANLHIQNVEIQSTLRSGLLARANGFISFAGIRFGTIQSFHIYADDHGYILCSGNYSVVGGGIGHMGAGGGGGFRCQARTVTLVGTPVFTGVFAEAAISGFLIVNGNTYSGSATGKRYTANLNGTILAGGAGPNYLPGSTDGTVTSGGQYV